MTVKIAAATTRFHGLLDTEVLRYVTGVIETKEQKYFIIQERDLHYRFSLHQHPYVQQLMQRLLRTSSAGLQAADTDYVPDARSLPRSVEVTVNPDTPLTIRAASTIVLVTGVQATSGGAAIALTSGMELETSGDASIIAKDALRATLAEGMTQTPAPDAVFPLTANQAAALLGDTRIVLKSVTSVTLLDGTPATIPAETEVVLVGGAPILIPAGTQVKLRRSKPQPVLFADFFGAAYRPDPEYVQQPYPVKDLDFTSGGAYAAYNWELFCHIPMTIAIHLSRNQRFAEAQRWFHYLFDPTDDSDGPTPERYWKVRPFQSTDVRKIEEVLVNLATGADEELRKETILSIEAWKEAPFRPHVIARYRQQAYMYKIVMAYLDNLIAWGDSLFRQDTGEAIDEAMMVYVLARNILGPRPLPVPKKGAVRPQTYDNLRKDVRQFGSVMRDVEADLPFDLMPFPGEERGDNDRLATLRSLGKALYFCVPRNDKLLGYWDTVDDRLFKIRNSLNFQGVFRQLALFEPPIDPALLARAAAAGLDVSAIVNGLNQPLPLIRFQLLVQKATEIVQEVKSLGNSLLSAMEKEDAEALAVLRSKHERAVMSMVEHVRYGQLQEATKSKEGLLQTLALAVQRYTFYEQQLGKKPDEIQKAIPEIVKLDGSLEQMKFNMKEGSVVPREIGVDIAQDLGASGGKIISSHEEAEMSLLAIAQGFQDAAAATDTIASILSAIPAIGVHGTPLGVGGKVEFGGQHLHDIFGALSSASRGIAGRLSYEANKTAKIGSYARREQDWAFQSNLAAGEINQIFKQLRAAEIREAIADRELKSHRQQMKHAEEIEQFLNEEGTEKKGKKTNKALYAWMKREVRGLYSQCFQFAFDIARKAERALQHELGNPGLSYLQFGYLTGKEGLLAGEKLHLDVKRMEMAYHDLNQREYELTKHVSLLQVDPRALIQLRATGRCTVRLPEELFDMDGPGHYFRRIKTVAVSIPCVAGPFTSVNCTLTLLKSSIRKSPVLRDGLYVREGAEDDRFSDYFGSMQAIVTSSGQNDSGLFETNLRDERYLPFENSGVVSEWQLTLPANPGRDEPAQFDYNTISDVVLHLRYTAREGGGLLRNRAVANAAEVRAAGTVRLFSVRHEFPGAWAKFQNQVPGPNQRFELTLDLRQEHYPFWAAGRLNNVTRVDILARSSEKPVPPNIDVADKPNKNDPQEKKDVLEKDASLGNLLFGTLANVKALLTPVGSFKLFVDAKAMADLWIAVTWGE